MGILLGILIVAFIFGLLFRNKGDGFLDTLSSGCGTIIVIVILIIVALVILMNQ